MNIDYYNKVKDNIIGHLPGYYDSRQLLYDCILKSPKIDNSVHIEIGTLCGGGTLFMLPSIKR